MLALLLVFQIAAAAADGDPFAFFRPTVTISTDDRRDLARGEPIAHSLTGRDTEVATVAAVPINIDGDRFVAWTRRIEELKRSSYVLAVGRFSDPPRIEDLSGVTLDNEDLSGVRKCLPGDCSLKLSAEEIKALQAAAAEPDSNGEGRVQDAFRRVLLTRVQAYLATGEIPAYEDKKEPTQPAARFDSILQHLPFLAERVPRFAEHLRGDPANAAPDVESFVYWSKERLARRAVISLTHVSILRGRDAGLPDALVAGRQIFATHYFNASLGLTAIVSGEASGPNYLVYVNRSDVDVVRGPFGGLIRWFLQRRLKDEAAEVLNGLRQRLERGEPPARR